MRFTLFLSSVLALACSGASPDPKAATRADAGRPIVDAGVAMAKPDAAPPPEVEPPAPGGTEFAQQVKDLYRVAACGGTGAVPARVNAKLIDGHCKTLVERYDAYKTKWAEPAGAFIANLRPKDLPKDVVYPFGGGDLVSALATYPDALEITTVSLEEAGDVRKIDTISAGNLAEQLNFLNTKQLSNLFSVAHSRTDNLGICARGPLPCHIVMWLSGLVIHGYEPVNLRYFELNPDGTIKYLTAEELDAAAKNPPKVDNGMVHAKVFRHMELQFRKAGDPSAPLKVFRHFAWDLSDKYFKDSPLHKHFLRKGKVSAMTKAASHLLWDEHFVTVRNYLLDNMAWMISDSTGVPPRWATKAGYVQDTYGIFEGPSEFGTTNSKDTADFKKLFLANPKVTLPFRYYGYPDNAKHGHIVVTRPAATK
jgi:hypothetical protein